MPSFDMLQIISKVVLIVSFSRSDGRSDRPKLQFQVCCYELGSKLESDAQFVMLAGERSCLRKSKIARDPLPDCLMTMEKYVSGKWVEFTGKMTKWSQLTDYAEKQYPDFFVIGINNGFTVFCGFQKKWNYNDIYDECCCKHSNVAEVTMILSLDIKMLHWRRKDLEAGAVQLEFTNTRSGVKPKGLHLRKRIFGSYYCAFVLTYMSPFGRPGRSIKHVTSEIRAPFKDRAVALHTVEFRRRVYEGAPSLPIHYESHLAFRKIHNHSDFFRVRGSTF
uniref:AlNc14C9G1145 protein n=1 Tax=Albugo laibachii Nc14 TaxID=890382 RepID=F0W286_9STRA|nr:AlNc14C9G1145 [Albugo laibachii Nc14]|eukprot:CCA15169.1 AlNc14C9G1145 [Albugo laibachii Nc14]